jgi:BASS family bile acid:Na+ symporter
LFRSFGWKKALALGFMVSQSNMGLMLAATGGVLPELSWFYFALSQFPIYLSPQLLQPLTRRILAKEIRIGLDTRREDAQDRTNDKFFSGNNRN